MPSLLDSTFEQRLRAIMAEWSIPGVAIAARYTHTDGETLREVRSYGSLSTSKPVTNKTLFPLFSVGKVFLVSLLGQLLEAKGLDFHTPVKSILPDFEMQNPELSDKVTVADLLGHTSGLIDSDWYSTPEDGSLRGMLATIKSIPNGDYGVNVYSNQSHDLAAFVAEELGGGTYRELMARCVLEPLGMSHTVFEARSGRPEAPGNLAMGHSAIVSSHGVVAGKHELEGWGNVGPRSLGERVWDGAAGLHSCAEDMIRWLEQIETNQYYKIAATPRAPSILDPDQLAPGLLQRSPPDQTPALTYGLSIFGGQLEFDGSAVEFHRGEFPGYVSAFIRIPAHGLSLVMLANSNEARELSSWVALYLLHATRGDMAPFTEGEKRIRTTRASRHTGWSRHLESIAGRIATHDEMVLGDFIGPNQSVWCFDTACYVERLPALERIPPAPWLHGAIRPMVTVTKNGLMNGCLEYTSIITGRTRNGMAWGGKVVWLEGAKTLQLVSPESFLLRPK